jgi:hypothetical protein
VPPITTAQSSILELIELTGICTQRHLATWTRTSPSYISQVIRLLSARREVIHLGRVVGPDASFLSGDWLRSRVNRGADREEAARGTISTNLGRKINRHRAFVSQTICACSDLFPDLRFVPEAALRRQGWFYKHAGSLPVGVANPLPTYVPDALLIVDNRFVRLEVQISPKFSCDPGEMIAACADDYPIVMVSTQPDKLSAGAAPHFPRLQIVPFGDAKALESALRLASETPS